MFQIRFKRLRRRSHQRIARELYFDIGARVRRLLLVLLGVAIAHTLAVLWFEDIGVSDAIWLTLTTLTTVGYGDFSAATVGGRIATTVLMYAIGITVLAQLASDYIDYRLQRRQRMIEGKWDWDMQDHLLVINTPKFNGAHYCEILVRQIRETPAFADVPIQFLTTGFPHGLPDDLRAHGALHRHGEADNADDLARVEPERARHVVVLAHDHYDRHADSLTFDTTHRLMQHVDRSRTHVVVECVNDANRQRLRDLGAHSVIRPIRAYPELIVRAIVSPGVETMMENLFTHHGDHSQRYDLPVDGLRWADLVAGLIQADLGTALAYTDDAGEVVCNPPSETRVHGTGLIVMVRANQEPTPTRIRECLAAIAAQSPHATTAPGS